MATPPHVTQNERTITLALKRREAEAKKILRTSNDFKHILLVCVWFPLPQHKVVDLLSTRWMARLDIFLDRVRKEQDDNHRHNWNNEGFKISEAEEILKILKSEEPRSTRPDLVGSFPSLDSAMEVSQMTCHSQTAYASRIALSIDSQISTAFYNTPFSEVIRAACCLQSSAIQRLLDVASQLRTKLSELPSGIYKLVQQELQYRDPLACWTLHTNWHDAEDSPDLDRPLSFLFNPIQDLFARQDLTVIVMLECLAVLAVLYNDKVVGGTHGDWQRFCSADFSFVKCLDNMDPRRLAQSITDNDEACFLNLRPFDYLHKTPDFRSLETHWNVLADTVKACCLTLPDSIDKISKVVEYLIRFRNFYSGPALLQGLENAQKHPKELAGFRRLIYTEGHYEFYQSQWQKAPALPFPVVHCYGTNWKTKTHDFFKFVLYSEWRRQGNEDDLSGYTASDSARTDTSGESDSKASEQSGVWYNTLAFLNSLVFLLHCFFQLRRSVAHRSLNSDVENCLLDSRTSVISLSLRDTHIITSSHCPREMEMSALSSPQPAHLRNEQLRSGSQMHFDSYQPLPTYKASSLSLAPASWRALARTIDPKWDLCLPFKRKERVKRVTRKPRFRIRGKQQTPEAIREKRTPLGHLTLCKARKPEWRARL